MTEVPVETAVTTWPPGRLATFPPSAEYALRPAKPCQRRPAAANLCQPQLAPVKTGQLEQRH